MLTYIIKNKNKLNKEINNKIEKISQDKKNSKSKFSYDLPVLVKIPILNIIII